MKRFYLSDASETPPSPPSAPSYGYPQDGSLSANKLPTAIGAYWYHMMTEEFMSVIEGAGLTPSETNLHQLADIFEDFRTRALKAESYSGAASASATAAAQSASESAASATESAASASDSDKSATASAQSAKESAASASASAASAEGAATSATEAGTSAEEAATYAAAAKFIEPYVESIQTTASHADELHLIGSDLVGESLSVLDYGWVGEASEQPSEITGGVLKTVATNLTPILATGEAIEAVKTVSEHISDCIHPVGVNLAAVQIVSGDIEAVVAAGANIESVKLAAQIQPHLDEVHAIGQDLQAVSSGSLDFGSTADKADPISTVTGGCIKTVAESVESVKTVAANIAAITTCNASVDSVKTVARHIDDCVHPVGQNITAVQTVSDDIDAVVTTSKAIESVKLAAQLQPHLDEVHAVGQDLQCASTGSLDFGRTEDEADPISTVTGGCIKTVAENVDSVKTVAASVEAVETTSAAIESVKTVAEHVEGCIHSVGEAIADVEKVSAGLAEVGATAAAIESVKAVAQHIDDCIHDVGANIDAVQKVSGSLAAVETTGAAIESVKLAAELQPHIDEVHTVGQDLQGITSGSLDFGSTEDDVDSVTTVTGGCIKTVAESVDSVKTVAADIDAIKTSNAFIESVKTVAAHVTDCIHPVGAAIEAVQAVSGSLEAVEATGENIEAVKLAAELQPHLDEVHVVGQDLQCVSTGSLDFGRTEDDADPISSVAGGCIKTVAESVASVKIVAESVSAVQATSAGIGAVKTVASGITAVETVNDNINAVTAVGENIEDVKNAVNLMADHKVDPEGHLTATQSQAGFMSAADKEKLDSSEIFKKGSVTASMLADIIDLGGL